MLQRKVNKIQERLMGERNSLERASEYIQDFEAVEDNSTEKLPNIGGRSLSSANLLNDGVRPASRNKP